MAKKDKKETTKAEASEPKESKKKTSAEDKLREQSGDYFKRFPHIDEIFATEANGFFFKRQHANSAAKGDKVFHFKKS
jgi:hypothetical protein